jgi:hypothetical protein
MLFSVDVLKVISTLDSLVCWCAPPGLLNFAIVWSTYQITMYGSTKNEKKRCWYLEVISYIDYFVPYILYADSC